MSRRTPLDRFFNRKLQYYSLEAPMELWDRIDARREPRRRQAERLRYQRAGLIVFLMTGLALSSLWWHSSDYKPTPVLRSFPIPLEPTVKTPPVPSPEVLPTPPVAAVAKATRRPIAAAPALLARRPATPVAQDALPAREVTVKSPAAQSSPPEKEMQLVLAGMRALPPRRPLLGKGRYSEDIRCAEFSPAESGKWTLDILASPDWSFRRLEPKEQAFSEYVESRKATESPDFNYSLGMRLSYVHPFGLLGRVGFNYTQINEKFEYRTENEEVITIRNILGPDGDVIGTDTLIESSVRSIFSNNRFETLDIPVILGYEKQFNKLSLAANAGLLFNVRFRSRGDFLSPMDGEPISFDDSEPDSYPAFRDRLGVGFYAGVSLAYSVAPKMQLVVEPHFKTYPQTITRDQYMVSQKYLLTGLSVGLRHQL